MTATVELERASLHDPVVVELVSELHTELYERYRRWIRPGEFTAESYAAELEPGQFDPPGVLLVVRVGGEVAGCGGVRLHAPGVGEIKRMYVRTAFRGRGLSRRLLAELERHAADAGFGRLVLETGIEQPEAMALYTSAGWAAIPGYGPYAGDRVSRCFAKGL